MQARTFVEEARRSQIVTAAIEVIAREGLAKATFGRIAAQAGVSSTGMISYYFAGKDDLIGACVTEAEQVSRAFMQPRIDAAEGVTAQIRAYVESNIALVGAHPAHVRAFIALLTESTSRSPVVDGRREVFVRHFERGQRDGSLRPFDVDIAARAFVAGIDAVVATAAADAPAADDLDRMGRELADLYLAAIAPVLLPGSSRDTAG